MPPQIRLDATVAELYRKHGISGPFIITTHCVFGHMDLHPEWIREKVFPEDAEPLPYGADERSRNRVRSIILGLKPVRRALTVGDMDVIILLGPGAAKENVDRVFSQLVPEQRPKPQYIDLEKGGVHERLLELSRGKKLTYWRAQGWQLHHDCLVPPRIAYNLNSKLFLLTSGIRTPPSEVVNFTDDIETSQDFILSTRPLPFVVKLFLAGCGFGTHLVTTEERRKIMLAAMADYKKRGGTQVLLSKYINAKRDDLSAHFIIGAPTDVRNRENPLIMGVCMQSLTTNGRYTGSSIDYASQKELQAFMQDTIRETTKRLPESFVGWCGLDIIIDQEDQQWVVDLNARYTGSMALCFLLGHFHERLCLRFAEFGSFQYHGACESVYLTLADYIESGRVIVNAAATVDDDLNMVDLIWGAHSQEELASMAEVFQAKLQGKK